MVEQGVYRGGKAGASQIFGFSYLVSVQPVRLEEETTEGSAVGKLFACKEKTFLTRAAVESRGKGTARHFYRSTSSSCLQSPESSAADHSSDQQQI